MGFINDFPRKKRGRRKVPITLRYTPEMLAKKRAMERLAAKLWVNQTKAELVFWDALIRRYPRSGVERQVVIGNYIVDFLFPKKRLVIELDGRHHRHDWAVRDRDDYRTKILNQAGYAVIRFPNRYAYDPEPIWEAIDAKLGTI